MMGDSQSKNALIRQENLLKSVKDEMGPSYYIRHYIRQFLDFLRLKIGDSKVLDNYHFIYIADILSDGAGDLRYAINYLKILCPYFVGRIHLIIDFFANQSNLDMFDNFANDFLKPNKIDYVSRLNCKNRIRDNTSPFQFSDENQLRFQLAGDDELSPPVIEISASDIISQYTDQLSKTVQPANILFCFGPAADYENDILGLAKQFPGSHFMVLNEASALEYINWKNNLMLFDGYYHTGFRSWEVGVLLTDVGGITKLINTNLESIIKNKSFIFNYVKEDAFKLYYLEVALIINQKVDIDFILSKVGDTNVINSTLKSVADSFGYEFKKNNDIESIITAGTRVVNFYFIRDRLDNNDILYLMKNSTTYVGCTGDSSLFEVISCKKIPIYDCPSHKIDAIKGLLEYAFICYLEHEYKPIASSLKHLTQFLDYQIQIVCPKNAPDKSAVINKIKPIMAKMMLLTTEDILNAYNLFMLDCRNSLDFRPLMYYLVYYTLKKRTPEMDQLIWEFNKMKAPELDKLDTKKIKAFGKSYW